MAEGSIQKTVEGESPARQSQAVTAIGEGIKTSRQFANVMSALMTDLIHRVVDPRVGNAVCNAGRNLLEINRMELRYGRRGADGNPLPSPSPLQLADQSQSPAG